MVDRWAQATGQEQLQRFEAALAVRQVEIGLASLLSLLLGLTIAAYGASLLLDRHAWRWLGGLALVAGVGSAVAGVGQAHSGFSSATMMLSMSASSIVLLWVLLLGVFLWRRVPQLEPRR